MTSSQEMCGIGETRQGVPSLAGQATTFREDGSGIPGSVVQEIPDR
jgi:hypothetical protein